MWPSAEHHSDVCREHANEVRREHANDVAPGGRANEGDFWRFPPAPTPTGVDLRGGFYDEGMMPFSGTYLVHATDIKPSVQKKGFFDVSWKCPICATHTDYTWRKGPIKSGKTHTYPIKLDVEALCIAGLQGTSGGVHTLKGFHTDSQYGRPWCPNGLCSATAEERRTGQCRKQYEHAVIQIHLMEAFARSPMANPIRAAAEQAEKEWAAAEKAAQTRRANYDERRHTPGVEVRKATGGGYVFRAKFHVYNCKITQRKFSYEGEFTHDFAQANLEVRQQRARLETEVAAHKVQIFTKKEWERLQAYLRRGERDDGQEQQAALEDLACVERRAADTDQKIEAEREVAELEAARGRRSERKRARRAFRKQQLAMHRQRGVTAQAAA